MVHRRQFLASSLGVAGGVLLSSSRAPGAADVRPGFKAYVWDFADKWSGRTGAARLLKEAGFDVEPLPIERTPFGLSGLIFIGSFASEDPRYAPYMKQHAAALYNFVDKGNVLLQMTQADQTESSPPFLPTTHGARRNDEDFDRAYVLSPKNFLLRGVPVTREGALEMAGPRVVWECFMEQGGFEVILSADKEARHPVLMEGAYGQGRIILTSLHFDKVDVAGTGSMEMAPTGAAGGRFTKAFLRNLREHVVNVRERRTAAVVVTPSPTNVQDFVDGSWTLAVLPDTQVYSLRYPGLYDAQTNWIARNRERRNIKYVIHLGDITNNNTPMEWRRARAAMALLDGVVPYSLVPGNHDYGPSGDASSRDTLMNEHFKFDTARSLATFGGAMEQGKLDNTFHLFEVEGRKWIIVNLEWGPREKAIAWANDVMSKHADRLGIFVTHAYLNNNDRRYDHTDKVNPQHYNPHEYRTPGGVHDGEELWQKLVRKHDFAFTLNGHVLGDGTGYLASRNDGGRTTHQILANYQMRTLGGESYLRLLEFLPDRRTVRVRTYSPLYDKYMLDADQQYTLAVSL